MYRWVCLGIVLISLLTGCSGGGKFSQRAQAGNEEIFRYPIVTSPTTLDPHKVEDGDTIDLLQQIYEPLVIWDENSKPVPGIAEKWDVSDGGKTYLFTLRSGVKFHNGKELDAEDAKWSLERATNPKLASPVAATYLSDIVGVADKLAGKAQEVSGIRVVSNNQLEIRITRPISFFVHKLTYLTSAVLPKGAVPEAEEIKTTDQMIGTGPFKAKSYAPDQLFALSANTDYYRGAPKVATIERPVVKDASTRLLKYKNGEIDLVQLERQDVLSLREDPKYKDQIQFFDRPAIWYLAMAPNTYAPFKNRDVRRAFVMAVNRASLVEEILGGVNRSAEAILPPAVEGARTKAAVLPYDPEQAKKLLASAGFPGGKGLPPVEFNYRDSRTDVRLIAEAIATQLQKNLGVNVNLRPMEWTAYLEKRDRKELQLYHMRWAADYLDPENFLTLLLTTNGPENKSGYSNPQVDRLCAEADVMPNGPQRAEKYAQAEDLVLQDAVWMPIYFQRDAELIRPRVQGLRESVFGHLPHNAVSLAK